MEKSKKSWMEVKAGVEDNFDWLSFVSLPLCSSPKMSEIIS